MRSEFGPPPIQRLAKLRRGIIPQIANGIWWSTARNQSQDKCDAALSPDVGPVRGAMVELSEQKYSTQQSERPEENESGPSRLPAEKRLRRQISTILFHSFCRVDRAGPKGFGVGSGWESAGSGIRVSWQKRVDSSIGRAAPF
jgi:hypothetical protein